MYKKSEGFFITLRYKCAHTRVRSSNFGHFLWVLGLILRLEPLRGCPEGAKKKTNLGFKIYFEAKIALIFGFSRVPPVRNWGQKCVSFFWKSHFKTRLGPKYLNLHPKNKDFEHFQWILRKVQDFFKKKRKLFIRLRFKIIESASKISKTIQFFQKKDVFFWIKDLFLIKKVTKY